MSDLEPTDTLYVSGRVRRDGVLYGCHCDVEHDEEIDGCVIETRDHYHCTYAVFPGGRLRRSRWRCKYWRRLPESMQARHD